MKNISRTAKVTRLPSRARRGVSDAEWQVRVELAAAYRLTALMGWTDMLGIHISCRVPGTEDEFRITAMTGGAALNRIPQEVIDHTLEQGKKIYSQGGRREGGRLMWAALKRKLGLVDPGYAA